MTDFVELENNAKRFFELKHSEKTKSELNDIAVKIIDQISLPEFDFPIHDQSVASNKVTTFVYTDNLTYPNLLEFIAEVLHTKIPVIINTAIFGPGEIIVNKENEQEALEELNSCIKELQVLIHAKKVKYS
ncbi:MAG: hypothetical protein M3264_01200 [Thermoproteota archaeon]|nr:hypothetical protein [Thermoproteota archaeon]